MKKIYLFLVCFLAFFMISCGEEKDPIKKVSSIESEDIVLMVGDTTNVELKYDKDAKVEFEWSSSDETIVTVSNGLLTALKDGNVEISVYEKNSGISTKIKVTVEKNGKDITELTTTYTAVLEDFVKTLPQETTENLPLLNDYNIVYVFETGISASGEITRNVENYEVKGKVQLVDSENNITLEKDYTVVIVGTFLDELAERFIGQFANGINGKMDVERKYDDFGGSYVRWESLSPEIFDNKGNLNRPFNNTYIEISYLVKSKEPEAEASYTSKVLVHGQSLAYKNALVEEWIKQAVPENSVLYPGDILPSECEDYKAKITWLDQNGQKADLAKLVVDPVLGNAVVFTVRVVYENSEDYLDFVMDYRVWNKKYQNDFEKNR